MRLPAGSPNVRNAGNFSPSRFAREFLSEKGNRAGKNGVMVYDSCFEEKEVTK
jgi:hypothetical protein